MLQQEKRDTDLQHIAVQARQLRSEAGSGRRPRRGSTVLVAPQVEWQYTPELRGSTSEIRRPGVTGFLILLMLWLGFGSRQWDARPGPPSPRHEAWSGVWPSD